MPDQQRLTKEEIKQKVLSHTHYDLLKRIGMASFMEKQIDEMITEAYRQGRGVRFAERRAF